MVSFYQNDLSTLHVSFVIYIHPLPDNKILALSKLKAFADDKLDVVKMMISTFDQLESSVGKGENEGYQHFLLFPLCFQKPSSFRLLKVRIEW